MSEPLKWLIFCGGAVLVVLPFTIVGWKRAGRDATKLIDQLTPPAGIELTDGGRRWLHDQFTRRLRWAVVTTQLSIGVTAPLLFAFGDVAFVDEAGPVMYSAGSMLIGYSVGSTFATVRSAHVATGVRRSATLAPRMLRTYLRRWELIACIAHALAAPSSLAVVIALWLTGRIGDSAAVVCASLVMSWILALGGVFLLQRSTLRTPPVVDEGLHLARELMLSFAIRSLLVLQLPIVGLVAFGLCTYAYLTVDSLPWALSMAPFCVIGAIGLGLHSARTTREERGVSAPEWQFARSLEPTS